MKADRTVVLYDAINNELFLFMGVDWEKLKPLNLSIFYNWRILR